MANLLPPLALTQARSRLWFRALGVGAVALTVAALVAGLALIPAFLAAHLADESLGDAGLSEVRPEEQAAALRAQNYIRILGPLASATSTGSDVIGAAVAARPPGVKITSIAYHAGSLLVSGTAQNRQAVSAYRDALDADDRFTAISVPVAALVGAQDGRFTLTLNGSF